MCHKRIVGDCDDTASRIPFRITERIELLEIHLFNASFLTQFPNCSGVERLIRLHKTSGKCIAILKRLGKPPDQQKMQLAIEDRKEDDIHSYQRLHHSAQATTRLAFSGAIRILAIAPELKSRWSASMPSEKITPPVGI